MPNERNGETKLKARLRRLDEVSWNFDGSRSRSPLSASHFHPARFISQVPSTLISLLSEPGNTVLDPFCGSGTTLVEAQRLGRKGVGLDINPVSVMVSRAKTLPFTSDRVRSVLSAWAASMMRSAAYREMPPRTVQSEKWYSPHVAALLSRLYADIQVTADPDEQLLRTFCFSSILLKVCREDRHWGYVCDNTRPQRHPPRKVHEVLQRAIDDIVEGFHGRDGQTEVPVVIEAPAVEISKFLKPASVDLVVTSPPYFGVVDYVKSQRLTLEWLGIDTEPYRKLETGARSKRHRRDAEAEFAFELKETFEAVVRALRPGGTCAVVFGTSPSRGFSFDRLIQILTESGLTLLRDHVRDVSLQRTLKPSVLTERLFVLTKPFPDQVY